MTNYEDLERLFAQCHRNYRLPTKSIPDPKIYFDADRFRWWHSAGIKNPTYMAEYLEGLDRGWSLQKFRDWFDSKMRTEDATA